MKKQTTPKTLSVRAGLKVELDKSKAEHAPYRKKDAVPAKRKSKPARSQTKAEPTRLIGGVDFVLVALTFESKATALSTSVADIERLVRAKVTLRKGFRRFSDIPEQPLTRVFQVRLSKKIGDPGTAREVARSAPHPIIAGRSYFRSTYGAKGAVGSFKVTL